MFGNLSSVHIARDFAAVFSVDVRIGQIFSVVPDRQDNLICHKPLFNQVQRQQFEHFPHYHSCLIKIIRTVQDLSRAYTFVLGRVRLDPGYCTRLITPCVVNQHLCVYSEKLFEFRPSVLCCGFPRYIAHCKHSVFFKFFRISSADPPKIGERLMLPKLLAIGHFIEICNPDPVFVGLHLFRRYVHRDFCKIHICTDSGGRGYSRSFKHIAHNRPRKVLGVFSACGEIVGYIHKYLINRIDKYIITRYIIKIYLIYFCRIFNIMRHSRRCNNIIEFKRWVGI